MQRGVFLAHLEEKVLGAKQEMRFLSGALGDISVTIQIVQNAISWRRIAFERRNKIAGSIFESGGCQRLIRSIAPAAAF